MSMILSVNTIDLCYNYITTLLWVKRIISDMLIEFCAWHDMRYIRVYGIFTANGVIHIDWAYPYNSEYKTYINYKDIIETFLIMSAVSLSWS